MRLCSTALGLALLGLASARELAVFRKEPKRVIVKSKGDGNFLWFSLSIQDGVPVFEIKGGDSDRESGAKAKVRLAMSNVREQDAEASYSLRGTQGYWGDIGVETRGGEKQQPQQIILHSRMVHPEKDIAGNYFTILLSAVIEEHAHEFSIRPMIQNFPYARRGGKGVLVFDQVLASSLGAREGNGATSQGPTGDLIMLRDSALEDGNPGQLRDAKLVAAKDRQEKVLPEAEEGRLAEVQFATTRPKNATFVERLVFDPKSIKLVHTGEESRSEKDKIKGMSISNASAPGGLVSSLVGAAMAMLLAILLQL